MKKYNKESINLIFFSIITAIVFCVCSVIIHHQSEYNKLCTKEIQAICTNVSEKYFSDEQKTLYRATYEYSYDGNTFSYSDDIYRSYHPKEGNSITLKINPENPSQATKEVTTKTLICVVFMTVFGAYELIAIREWLRFKAGI